MQLRELVTSAGGAVLANKLRSALTILGIVIGIAAVITMVALGAGAQQAVEARLANLGAHVLTILPGQLMVGGIGRGRSNLTIADAEALATDPALDFAAISPEVEGRLQVEVDGAGGGNANLSMVGVWPSYFAMNNLRVSAGRLFNDREEEGRRRVAVLGSLVGGELGVASSDALLGTTLRIRGVPFEVVGALAERGASGFSNPDDQIYVPLASARFRLLGEERVRSIAVQVADEAEMTRARIEIDRVLRREHKVRPGQEADFNVRDQTTVLETVQETTRTFTFLLASIAAISLVVGGIGIMNIMLVSVTERTREIGLRKAVGARQRDILQQFLLEAVILCLAGGAIGLGAGWASSMLLERLSGWQMAITPGAALLAFAFSAGVGLFFGFWPARRAASLEPVEAMRWE